MTDPSFKTCGSCGHRWPDWRSLVLDSGLRLLGLQVIPGLPDSNVLVFEHSCGTSVSVLTSRLRHLLPIEDQADDRPLLFGTEKCNGHCRFIEDLSRCDQPCGNARDRRLAILIAEARTGGADLSGIGSSRDPVGP
jgi:hypothetical protein